MTTTTILRAALAAGLLAPALASAHIGYGGRDFGSYGVAGGTKTIANQAASGNFGWADGTDDDFGDSHKLRAFRFTLTDTLTVTFSVAANAGATATSVGGLIPGFSIYQGLAHLAPAPADYDSSAGSAAYLASLPGPAKEGAFRALTDWKLTNDNNDPLTHFVFKGYAVDGSAANFGSAPGVVGDGVLDGFVTGTFILGPGDYSVFVGGADYAAQLFSSPPAYGMTATFSAAPVPEAETYAMMLAGLGLVGVAVRRRVRG